MIVFILCSQRHHNELALSWECGLNRVELFRWDVNASWRWSFRQRALWSVVRLGRDWGQRHQGQQYPKADVLNCHRLAKTWRTVDWQCRRWAFRSMRCRWEQWPREQRRSPVCTPSCHRADRPTQTAFEKKTKQPEASAKTKIYETKIRIDNELKVIEYVVFLEILVNLGQFVTLSEDLFGESSLYVVVLVL